MTGDTVYDLACNIYNDCSRYPFICAANDLDPCGLIHADNELWIPYYEVD